jgi:hypothetical protein
MPDVAHLLGLQALALAAQAVLLALQRRDAHLRARQIRLLKELAPPAACVCPRSICPLELTPHITVTISSSQALRTLCGAASAETIGLPE